MAEKISEDVQEKLRELQLLQQRMTIFTAQKQQLQIQLAEIEAATAELGAAKPPVYRLVGEILIEKSPEDLKKELKDKKEELDIRIKTLEKQEVKIRDKAQDLQKIVAAALG